MSQLLRSCILGFAMALITLGMVSLVAAQTPLKPVSGPPEAPIGNLDLKDALKVAKGQLTFDLEGSNAPDSPFFSLVVHWPGGSSGVTIGRGYDMGNRSRDQVIKDLTEAGLDGEKAKSFAEGAGLKGTDAKDFVLANKDRLGQITLLQQKNLFEKTYAEAVEVARKGVNEATKWSIRLPTGEVRTNEKRRTFDQLPPAVQEVAADLAFNLGAKQFENQGWGGIFQMGSFRDMGEYLAGKLPGEVLDSKGSPVGEASQILAKWRSQVGKQRLEALIANLNKAADGALTEPSLPTGQPDGAPGAGYGKESKEVGFGDAIAMKNYPDWMKFQKVFFRLHRVWEKPSPNVPLEGAAFREARQGEKWYIVLAEIQNNGESDVPLTAGPFLKIRADSNAEYLGSCQSVDGPASLKPISPNFRVPRKGSVWRAYIFLLPREATPVTLVEAEAGGEPRHCDLFHLNLRKADGSPEPAASGPDPVPPEPPRREPARRPSR